ncbi:Uncharacterised protein [Mycobacteroides abscessus subsp. abscessus]|nr:Uncharacterised protein [Mycobacteroides abscessus subsp. abscessus]
MTGSSGALAALNTSAASAPPTEGVNTDKAVWLSVSRLRRFRAGMVTRRMPACSRSTGSPGGCRQ